MEIKIFTVGGTIDKIYFDKKDTYAVGESMVGDILKAANVDIDFTCEALLYKDSLDMSDADRQLVYDKIVAEPSERIIITHGTDTMVATAKQLIDIAGKVIVLTGSMAPARFKSSDAEFNIGCAVIAVQTLPAGVYIIMNGKIFDPKNARKNIPKNKFEAIH